VNVVRVYAKIRDDGEPTHSVRKSQGIAFILLICLVALCGMQTALRADGLPAHLVPSQLSRLDADSENVGGPFPGLLLVPHGEQKELDSKYSQPFHAACYVYIVERATGDGAATGYAQRFIVHVPDAETLPLAKRVARMLLLLFGEDRARLGFDHPISDPTVQVWLTNQSGRGNAADAGGEQIKSDIYIYSITAERPPIEWAREIAHEYGHYALPGVSGYTAPEEWANGMLGERLFLKWLEDDLHTGRLHAEDIPFVTPEQLDAYITRQVTPLLIRIAREGVDERQMARRDAAGMDYYTGFALYLDSIYGSRALLDALSYTTPRQGGVFIQAPDFLRGARASLANATQFTVTLPRLASGKPLDPFFIYLPAGEFLITADGPVRSWEFDAPAKGLHPISKKDVLVGIAAWRRLRVTLSQAASGPARLTFQRKGTEVQ
jgi:hypothetical protein